MAQDDWRNLPAYVHGGPNGAGTWYQQPDYGDVEFTPPASGDGSSGETIEVIRRRIMNQHPEDISALADQWQNAYNLMDSIRDQLLAQSNTLYEQSWRAADARDAFMEKGPGVALAYLREWMHAANDNVTALRQLVGIARQSRGEMETLWGEYQDEIEAASHADGWTRAKHGALWGVSLGFYDGERGVQADEQEAVLAKQREFNRKAQELAWRVGNRYFETMSTLSGGHGPPFMPMNVILNRVGHPPFPTMTGPVSPGGPPAPAPPPAITTPQALTGPSQGLLTQVPPPPVTVPGPVVAPARVAPPAVVGPPPVVVSPPVVVPPPALVPTPHPAGPAQVPPAVRTPSPLTRLSPNRDGLSTGLIQGRGLTASTPEATPGALRSPAATPPPPMTTGQGNRQPPGAQGRGDRPDASRQPGAEQSFGGSPTATTPPVLSNQRPTGQPRPGSRHELHPGPSQPGVPSPLRPAGTAPPVLSSPGTTAAAVTTPAAARDTTDRTAPDSEWVGVAQARADASVPVLDAPAPPPTGGAVSRLEEAKLRGRAATTPATPARSRPASTVAPELTTRRGTTGTASPSGTEQTAEEGRRIITDQEAFTVDTPGGGVVAKRQDGTDYRAEPPPVLRNPG